MRIYMTARFYEKKLPRKSAKNRVFGIYEKLGLYDKQSDE